MSSRPESSTGRRKALGVEEFAAGKKGVTRAIQEYKSRKERKVKHKAVLLRQYKTAMRKEGYQAGSGARRKRKTEERMEDSERKEEVPGESASACVSTEQIESPAGVTSNKRQRRHKTNPFAASLQKAQTEKQKRSKQQFERDSTERERQRKLKQRKESAKVFSKRTRRGQPVMKNVIHNILDKLQK